MDIVNTLMDSTLRDSLAESCMTVRQTQTDTQTDRQREKQGEKHAVCALMVVCRWLISHHVKRYTCRINLSSTGMSRARIILSYLCRDHSTRG